MNTVNLYDTKINGRLTKRAIIRRMWARSISGANGTDTYNKKYVARAIKMTVNETRAIVRWMVDHNMIIAREVGANFVFSF